MYTSRPCQPECVHGVYKIRTWRLHKSKSGNLLRNPAKSSNVYEMSTKHGQNKPTPRATTPLTANGLRAIAEAIAKELSGYELIAQKMEELQIESIPMTGIDSLESAVIKRIQGNIEGARRALNKETSGSLKATALRIVANRNRPTEAKQQKKKSEPGQSS